MSKQDKWKFIYWVSFVIAFFAGKLSATMYAKRKGESKNANGLRDVPKNQRCDSKGAVRIQKSGRRKV